MKKQIRLILAVFGVLSLYSVLWAQTPQVHTVTADKEKCGECHIMSSENQNSPKLKDDISSNCLKCHPQEASNHPVQIAPTFSVPKDLPLSETSELTCITCHNPHTPRFSTRRWQASSLADNFGDFFQRKKQYETYFLRRNNAQGNLCFACHKELTGE